MSPTVICRAFFFTPHPWKSKKQQVLFAYYKKIMLLCDTKP